MKAYKRLLAVILVAAMVFPLLPGQFGELLTMRAFAAEPIIIHDEYAFASEMAKDTSNKFYFQTKDFTLTTSQRMNAGEFKGTYDGNGFTITYRDSNQTMNSDSFGGVFGTIAAGATVMNLNVGVDMTIKGRASNGDYQWAGTDYIGGIAAKNNGTITNCSVTGKIKVSQHLTKKTAINDAYNGFGSFECKTVVGGIAGITTSGTISGCYSDVLINAGSHSDPTFKGEYKNMVGYISKSGDFAARYIFYTGGIAGEISGSAGISNCLVEDMNIRLGIVDNSDEATNHTTYGYAGGIVGLVQSGTPTISNNVRRGGYLHASMKRGRGLGASVAGTATHSDRISKIQNNFTDSWQSVSVNSSTKGFSIYTGESYSGVQAASRDGCAEDNNPTAGMLSSMWTSDLRNSTAATLKWRTVAPPTVVTSIGNDIFTEIEPNKFRITLAPSNELVPRFQPDPNDPIYKLPAGDIRYELTISKKGKLGTPGAKLVDDEIILTAADGDVATLYYGESASDINKTDNIPVPTGAGESVSYWIQARDDSSVKKDSDVVPITVTRGASSSDSYVLSIDDATKSTGQHATPTLSVVDDKEITFTPPATANGVEWWPYDPDDDDPDDDDLSVTKDTPIKVTELALGAGTYTYCVKAVGDNANYAPSNTLKFTFEVENSEIKGVPVESIEAELKKGKLAQPVVSLSGSVITFTPVANASVAWGTTTESLTKADLTFDIKELDGDTYHVKSVSNDEKYDDSEPREFTVKVELATGAVTLGEDGEYPPGEGEDSDSVTYTFDDKDDKVHEHTSPLDPQPPSDTMTLYKNGTTIKPDKVVLKLWMVGDLSRMVTLELPVKGQTATPIISPGENGNLGESGITLSMPPDQTADIYYTISYNDGEDLADPTTTVTDTNFKYSAGDLSWDKIKNNFTGKTLRIKAVAESVSSDDVVSAVASMTYKVVNKPKDGPPKILIDDEPLSSTTYYDADAIQKIVLQLPDQVVTTDGTIYYTVDGTTPSKSSTPYNPSDGINLQAGNKRQVELRAVYVRDNFPDSEVLLANIRLQSKHGEPRYSIDNGTSVPIGQMLTFMLDPDDLPEEIRPKFYIVEGNTELVTLQAMRNNPADYYGVVEVDADALGLSTEEAYKNYYSRFAADLPTIKYKKDNAGEKTYTYATPEIRFMKNGAVVYTVEHRAAEKIELSGVAGGSIKVEAWFVPGDSRRFVDGPEGPSTATNTYNFFLPVEKPKASPPATIDEKITEVGVGSKISLSSATSGAKIFYSTTETPDVKYSSADDIYTLYGTTKEYVATEGIMVEGAPGGYFTIHAGAAKSGMSASESVTFVYRIADLAKVAAPTGSPLTTADKVATIEIGKSVVLMSATSDSRIFYSTEGVPSVTYNSSTKTYTTAAGTYDYNTVKSTGITATGEAGGVFTVYAVAMKDGMSASDVVTFTYLFPAPVQAVLASPMQGTVVKDTKVTLSTTTEGATIFYEVSTSSESAADPKPNESTVFDSAKPIVIDKDTTIKAIAVKDNVSSVVTTYKYTLAGEIGALTPSIPTGSVVARGTKVTLKSATSGVTIIYTKDGSDPTDEKNTARMFGSDIIIDADEGKSVTIKAYATKSGMTPSAVLSLSYSVSKSDQVMTANPATDTVVRPGDQITLSTSVTGAAIHYTIDGSEPTAGSTQGSVVTVDGTYGGSFSIRAVAIVGGVATPPSVFNYKIMQRTAVPTSSIPSGAIILRNTGIELSAKDSVIYYTTDGSEPTTASQVYMDKIPFTDSMVIKAIAVEEGKAESAVAEFVYTMAGHVSPPTANIQSGTVELGSKITLSTLTEGASIYYTTNGMTPTADNYGDSFLYNSSITILSPVTIRMFAVKDGMRPSAVNSVTYTVSEPAPEPEQEDESGQTVLRDNNRLFLFDQFVDSGEGPTFTDVILRDAATMTTVSARANVLPDGVELIVSRERSPSAEEVDSVRRGTDMDIGALYNIALLKNGEPVELAVENAIEIGMPIPEGYGDTMLAVCRINDNGTVTSFPTRRSGGMVYAVVDKVNKYAVAVPAVPEAKSAASIPWYFWMAGAVLTSGAAAAIVVVTRRKKKA